VPLAAPARGVLLPSEFISVAEESGLIVPLGKWVLHEACRQAAAWREAGLKGIRMAVNVSALSCGEGFCSRRPRHSARDPLRPGLHRAGTHRDFPASRPGLDRIGVGNT